MATHGRDLRFLLFFGLMLLAYYFVSTTSAAKDRFFPWFLQLNADLSGIVLHAVGYDDLQVRGNSLIHPKGAVSVERGCDAIVPCVLFVAAVLASPVPWRSKLPAALLGCLLLMLVNLFRIISLFLTRVHWPEAFDAMHLDVWQSLFIGLSILLWIVWAAWDTRRRARKLALHAKP